MGGQVINTETGQIWDADGLIRQIEDRDKRLPLIRDLLDAVDKRTSRYYKLRNYCFLFGFVLLTVTKVVKPYLG